MSKKLDRLLAIMEMLRDPQHGCPWDLQQNFKTIAPHTLEEVYEVIETIEHEDYQHLPNELGDLLFQVVFYAQLGKEAQLFDFDAVVDEIATKLLQRHPHVFPDASMENFGIEGEISPGQVEANWEIIKQSERETKAADGGTATVSALDDIPLAFPALTRARKLQKRAARTGFDWDRPEDVFAKIDEELAELKEAVANNSDAQISEELGDLLFTVVNLSRHLNQEPETSLRGANRKFERRFRIMEHMIEAEDKTMSELSMAELENYWQQAKQQLKGQ